MSEPIEFYIRTPQVAANASQFVGDIMPDEKNPLLVKITDYKETRSGKQNKLLNGPIYNQISQQTGENRDTIHNDFYSGFKKRFALPIFMRDDDQFREMIFAIRDLSRQNKEQGFMVAENILKLVSTTNFNTKQMAEFITEILQDCHHKGIVIILNSDDKKLLT